MMALGEAMEVRKMAEETREPEGAIGPDGKMMELPEKARILRKMVGDWKLNGIGRMEGQESAVKGSWCESPTAGGFAVSGRQRLFAPDGKTLVYRATDLWGYDAMTDEFYFYIDNAGQAHDLRGWMVQPDKLEFEYEGEQGGKDYGERAEVDFISDDEIEIKARGELEGETEWDFDMVFTRA
jgi:hypothetical protein